MVVLAVGCVAQSDEPPSAVSLPVVAAVTLVETDHYVVRRRVTGVLQARQRTELGFELGGKLAQLTVDVGDRVVANQPLATLDTALLIRQQERLTAQTAAVDARLAFVNATLRRRQNLAGNGFSSAQELDDLEGQAADLQAQRAQIAADAAAVRTQIDKATLRAPFAGVIAARYQDTGAVIASGTPILRLLEADHWEARVGLPPALQHELAVGDAVALQWRGQPLTGRVTTLERELDPRTRTVTARIALPATPFAFVHGDLINLMVHVTVAEPGFWLPLTALTDGGRGQWRVLVLAPTADDPTRAQLEPRDVVLIHATGDRAFVRGALAAGESVLAQGVHKFAARQTVRMASATAVVAAHQPVPVQP